MNTGSERKAELREIYAANGFAAKEVARAVEEYSRLRYDSKTYYESITQPRKTALMFVSFFVWFWIGAAGVPLVLVDMMGLLSPIWQSGVGKVCVLIFVIAAGVVAGRKIHADWELRKRDDSEGFKELRQKADRHHRRYGGPHPLET